MAEPGVILWAILGYLCGSVPFGLLLAKASGLGDVRSIGSGNIGATNVLRTGNKKVAFATLALDVLKGTVPVLLARQFAGETAAIVAGVGAFLGHVFPVWLKFKGGKGVATYIGVLLAWSWPLALMFGAVWIVLAIVMRYSSVSSLAGSALTPVFAWMSWQSSYIVPGIIIAGVIFWAHRGNIARLMRGEESRIQLGSRKPAGS